MNAKIKFLMQNYVSSYIFIGNGPQGLENGVRMGNRSGYKAIVKNNPYAYRKTAERLTSPNYPKDYGFRHD